MNKLDWNRARAFCFTAETGSLSAAARELGLTQPTLSRQIAALEAELGVTLFQRVGKKLVLTETGLGLIEHVRAMAAGADAMALAAEGRAQEIEGRVTISATDSVSAYLLPSLVARIRAQAPQITVSIVSSNTLADLRRREADIAVRHVRPREPELIGRLVGEMSARFYAAETWVARNGVPRTLAALAQSELLGYAPVERFAEHLEAAGIPIPADQFRVVSESAVVVWEMVRAGLGIGMMLDAIAERTAGVRQLMTDQPPTPVPVWLVTHRELRTSRRVRVVFDLMADGLGELCQRGTRPARDNLR